MLVIIRNMLENLFLLCLGMLFIWLRSNMERLVLKLAEKHPSLYQPPAITMIKAGYWVIAVGLIGLSIYSLARLVVEGVIDLLLMSSLL